MYSYFMGVMPMTLDEARKVLKAGPQRGADAYVRYATACAVIYVNHERRMGRMTYDSKPREETSRECVDRLAREWRDQQRREERMPTPSGIMPNPPPVDPRTGLPMNWTAGMSMADVTRAWRANDAARSNRLLHEMNEANARYWGQRR